SRPSMPTPQRKPSAASPVAFCKAASKLPYRAIKSNIADSLSILVHLNRRPGRRFISEVVEISGYNPELDRYDLTPLFARTEEEGIGLRNLDIGKTPVGESPGNSCTALRAASHEHATQSETIARRYIQENFEATDWLELVVRNRETGETVQRIATAQQIASH